MTQPAGMDKPKEKILIVEDEKDIATLIEHHLTNVGYRTTVLHNGEAVLSRIAKDQPRLIILDVMLPGMNGFELCRAIKGHPQYKNIPIIFLTAKSDEVDRVVGFELGVDDYVTKPFSPRELILRVRAILARSNQAGKAEEPVFEFGGLRIDWQGYRVFVDNQEVILTKLEFNLLKHLVKSRGRVLSRDYLLDQVWGYNTDLETRTVDTHVKRLRDKILSAGEYIETVRGVGYRFQ
jgi:two-component system phosphate regulon response regulator PhoB